jgi:hypothetical protein
MCLLFLFKSHSCNSATAGEPFSPWAMIGATIGTFFDFLVTFETIWCETCVAHFPVICPLLFSTCLATTYTSQRFTGSRYSHYYSPFSPRLSR